MRIIGGGMASGLKKDRHNYDQHTMPLNLLNEESTSSALLMIDRELVMEDENNASPSQKYIKEEDNRE